MVESDLAHLRVDEQELKLTKKDKKVFCNLFYKMRFVSLCIALEILWTILTIFRDWNSFRSAKWFNDTISLTQIIVFVLISYMTYQTACSFKLIGQTEGDDADSLMQALEKMKDLYKLQRHILEITLVFLGIYIIVIGVFVVGVFLWNRLKLGQ